MLATLNRQLNSVFERIVRDKNGVLVCIRFIVVKVDGRFRPEIISVKTLDVNKQSRAVVACLPKFSVINKVNYTCKFPFTYNITPYFSLDFFMSQPTRAPSL